MLLHDSMINRVGLVMITLVVEFHLALFVLLYRLAHSVHHDPTMLIHPQ